jgi:putative heme-binding domain-containing protein
MERKTASAAAELERVAREGREAAGRVQAVAALACLRQLKPKLALPLLTDKNPEVRRLGVRLCEPRLNQREILDALLRLVDDPSLAVRVQLAYTLGASREPLAAEALVALARPAATDLYLTGAALSSVRPDNVIDVLDAALSGAAPPTSPAFLDALLAVAGATGDAPTLAAVAERVVGQGTKIQAWAALSRVLEAADRRRLPVGEFLSEAAADSIRGLVASAVRSASSSVVAEADRIAAIELLGCANGPAVDSFLGAANQRTLESLQSLVAANQPPAIQSAAVQALARAAGDQAPDRLLPSWAAATPRLRGEILDALLSRESWAAALLDAVEQGQVRPNDLDATRRQRLLSHKTTELRRRAERLLASSSSSDRAEVLSQWQAVAAMPGDHVRGQEAFRKRCAVCHKWDGIGSEVGPDLAALTNKSTASLLTAVLDPNRDVDGRYVSYLAELADGRTVSGVLVGESGASVTLREQEGKEHVILRADLEALRSTGKSAMPEGLEKDMTPQELADVMAFLLAPRGAEAKFLTAAETQEAASSDPSEIAKRLLDDSQPAELRHKLIAEHPQQAAAIIAALTAELPAVGQDTKEEYRRIPWIWRVAVAAGKRNQSEELRTVLDTAMLKGGQPLRDWQAVVIGGGIINGVSQAGVWPKARLEEVLKVEGQLIARWQRSIELAAAMADDEKVPTGTRYDGLRMIALGSWDLRGKQLEKYLAPGAHEELQMGAVSGAADMPAPQAAQALVAALPHLTRRNRELALEGLLRSPERCLTLLDAIADKRIDRQMLDDARRQRLLEHAEATVRRRAADTLNAAR